MQSSRTGFDVCLPPLSRGLKPITCLTLVLQQWVEQGLNIFKMLGLGIFSTQLSSNFSSSAGSTWSQSAGPGARRLSSPKPAQHFFGNLSPFSCSQLKDELLLKNPAFLLCKIRLPTRCWFTQDGGKQEVSRAPSNGSWDQQTSSARLPALPIPSIFLISQSSLPSSRAAS